VKAKRAISVSEILSYKPKVMNFEGRWFDSFGTPEMTGCWLIWGNSGNGKTRFTLQLCKYLTQFGRVAYNSLEEGLSYSMKLAIMETGMIHSSRRFVLLDKEPVPGLISRLEKRKSPDIVVIDSLQYSGLDKLSAKKLTLDFPKKLFIFVSHADGKNPLGRTANSIKFDANLKLRVEGYKIPAPISRFKKERCAGFVIWEEGANEYWGE
jgi:hypothetical protein